ncbi:hypothetical protein KR093_007963 [Drosophila rubida]|uniref:Spatacsin C-terminal domain-containing protein n=1 Tax=Drosophila rubida TaxID=30044 RepID=A0AAD4K0V8_9MUSC|nr:hypothetical protein KR093_007963 [Drosophila rubida]
MHSAQARNKIFKSWSGISEVSIIKEVATKGEHIDLCMEYWAAKQKIPVSEYRHYFYDVVHAYVRRLLSERLVCKADNVLHNVERDVKCFFYQYACECNDADLSEFVLDHLRCRDPQLFEQEQTVLEYYWSLVQQLRECSDLLNRHKTLLPRVHIEALMTLPEHTLQLLLVELYFANHNDALLPELQKQLVWQHLVDTAQLDRLRRWFWCQDAAETAVLQPLEQAYVVWKIEAAMFEYALDHLVQPCEPLRNYFARAGYFFAAESAEVATVLRRLCTMQCLDQHKELICRLPLARHLLERGYHSLLLLECVPVSALEQLAGENEPLLTLLIDLKTHDPTEREGFELLSKSAQSYLERTHHAAESLQEEPLLTFFDFLCHEPSVHALEGFLASSNLSRVPYLKSLMSRFERHVSSPAAAAALPTAHELFYKMKQVNLAALAAAHPGELVSFSNPRLSQRYARKAQLNYTHYLKQQRSAYAVYYLLMEQLQLYGQITRVQLFHACETATQLALQHAGDDELVTHCVACCEMLDFDTQTLRSFLHLQRRLPATSTASSYTEQLQHWDSALVHELQQTPAQFPLESYTALMRLAARNLQGKWPTAMLQHFAASNDWWQLLLLFQHFDLPLSELQQLLPHFKCRALGVHMLRALSYSSSHERQHKRAANRQTRRSDGQANSSQDTITNSSHSSGLDANLQQLQRDSGQSMCSLLTHNAQQDVFAIVLCSSNNLPEECINSTARFVELMQSSGQQSTSVNLLKHCVRHQMPVLAVLAATLNDQNRDWCWLVWLAVASGQWTQLLLEASRSKEQQEQYVWWLIRNVVKAGQLNALLHSFCIFQPDCKFAHLCRFLQLTAQQQDFSEATIVELRHFLCSWSQDAVQLPLCAPLARKQLMQRCIGLLLMQLQCNFDCSMQQQKFLECICRSDVGDICDLLDFCLLHRIFGVAATWIRQLGIDYEQLVRRDSAEYKRLVDALTEAKAYEEALQLAALLQLPLADIVYAKWLAELEAGQLHQQAEYEREIEQHALPPAILVNFLLQAAAQQPEENLRRRYELLQSALGVIKLHHLFPNECFDRDQIEYDMVMCYLQLEPQQATSVPIYHSEYFEQIMRQERCVLYKSFSELKELAGIDDLSIANKSQLTPEMEQRLDELLQLLLDEGDIVEALRLQELFEFRPNDLRFIVFAMALAEGMTSIVNLSSKERQLLSDIEKSAFPKFNRLTLNQNPLGRCSSDLSASCSTLEFEEIPSKEKQQTLDTLLGIGSKLKHGVELGRRIVLAYRAAMYLDKEYLDVLRTKDASVLLRSAAEEDCLQRLLVVSDIHISTRLTPKEIADSLALELTTCIVRPRFYIFHASQQPRNAPRNADLWGHNIDRDFHLFLELTPNTTLLGNCLLEYCDALKAYRRYQDKKPFDSSDAFERLSGIITLYGLPNAANTSGSSSVPGSPAIPQVLSHKKQNQIYVELLIKANLCFVHECSMEGIASVLERAKHLNGQLAKAKSWSLIVRLLIGIARYREMFYCFDSLIENEQFESLLGQFDDDQKSGLRQAILGYLREYNPKNGKELLRLAAHHFLMYKELAEMWTAEAQDVLQTISSAAADAGRLRCSQGLQSLLQQALENYTHATENYLLDNKLILAQQSVGRAELMAMQLDLCNKALEKRGGVGVGNTSAVPFCISVIGVQTREQFRELVNQHLSVPQTLILSRAYGYDVNWSEALLTQFVVLQRRNYLHGYRCHQRINDNVIEQVVKGYILYTQNSAPTSQQQECLGQLVEHIRSVTLKYKLASILGLKLIVMSLINEQTVHYLRDTNYGRNEPHNVANM